MKKLVCGVFGNIYWATILKQGMMSPNGRVEVTSDAVNCVAQHLRYQKEFDERRWAGYSFENGKGKKLKLIAFDPEVYKLVPINNEKVEK